MLFGSQGERIHVRARRVNSDRGQTHGRITSPATYFSPGSAPLRGLAIDNSGAGADSIRPRAVSRAPEAVTSWPTLPRPNGGMPE